MNIDHPYRAAGAVLIVLGVILIAFDLGVLARCGNGEGLCFDVASHGTSDAGLVLFFVLFMVGVALLVYGRGTSSTYTRTDPPAAAPAVSPVTVVNTQPVQREVYVASPAPQAPTTVVTVTPPR